MLNAIAQKLNKSLTRAFPAATTGGALLTPEKLASYLETPPDPTWGDFALPGFRLAQDLGLPPAEILARLKKALKPSAWLEKAEIRGPYLNLFLRAEFLAKNSVIPALKKSYGRARKTGQIIVVEFPSPNTNKPLHLGHLRNLAIGESYCRLLESNGYTAKRVNLNNDRGIHICKSMLAYKLYGKGITPKKAGKKSDHLIGDFYVLYNQKIKEHPELEQQAQDLLVAWENGDVKVRALWKKMNRWAFDGFKATYKNFGIKHQKEYFESEIYTQGRDIVLKGLQDGIFQKRADGAVVADLTPEGLEEKVLLRADGTTVYMTQDLYLAQIKERDFHPQGSVFVVGNEQGYHFKVLFNLLKKLKFPSAANLKHLAYGMVNLPEGRMKSREGNVVDADNLIDEVTELARAEISGRYADLSADEINERARVIALAAIKYRLISVDIFKNIVFDPKEALSFEGNTGTYLLYAYARAGSVLGKASGSVIPEDARQCGCPESVDKQIPAYAGMTSITLPTTMEISERVLARTLGAWTETIQTALAHDNPALIAHYAYDLAQNFNTFYHTCPILESTQREWRVALTQAVRRTLGGALNILNIETLEVM